MIFNRVFLIGVCVYVISINAQAQKKQFSMAEATNGMSTTLATKTVKNPSWEPGTERLWQTEKQYDKDVWKVTNYSGSEKETVAFIEQGKYPEDEKVAAIPSLKWMNKDTAYFINGKDVVTGILNEHHFTWSVLAKLPEKADNITVDKSNRVAYTIDNNLWLYDKEKGNMQVSHESNKDIVCGQAVHRNEFGIETGIFFSPHGHYLAYYRMDQSMVADYPVVDWSETPAKVNMVKYPMAGGVSHRVTLCVYNPATGNAVTMNTEDKEIDHYLTCVTWSPDEQYIYIAVLNRRQDHLWLNKYDATTGKKVDNLFEEKDEKYVHPTHPLTFLPGRKDEFIWWSERDGYEHLYLYRTDGRLIGKLTKGDWVVNEIAGFDMAKKEVIVSAAKESPIEKHIYAVGLENEKIARIDQGAGWHNALCSEDGRWVLDTYSGTGVPKNCTVRATNGGYHFEIVNAPDPLAGYDRPAIKDIAIKAADGKTKLYGKLILPTNFDSTRKYPVIVYLYNGPNVQLIHNSFPESGNLWFEYMAQHGYIVFTMDGRGSWNRGKAFEQATFRHLGDVEMEDQLRGVAYLKSLHYVDTERMGVHGWSFGGFMTTSLMVKHPNVFKCAVAGGPVMDWAMYEVMYTERYMSKPQENGKGYDNANLMNKAKNLTGKLLLIHGTNDDVVVWQQSLKFIKKAVEEGVQVDYFVYPGHQHNVRGKDRVHLMQKITDYFDDHLKK